jgi:hypothetical protein
MPSNEGSIVGAVAAIVVALVALAGTLWSQRLIRHNQGELALLQAKLAERHDERAARRDYEYEARRTLYSHFEPIRFQLMEACENAIAQIEAIADQARQGNLGDTGWLGHNTYFLKSTVYQLLLPTAMFRLMTRRLTLVDLQLDRSAHAVYVLNRAAYWAFTDDDLIARLLGVEYTPYVTGWTEKRKENPAKFRRQGFPRGRLDNTLEVLITGDDAGAAVLSFGRFEEQLDQVAEADVSSGLGIARDMFVGFDPQTRPVLWQIMLTHAVLYRSILKSADHWQQLSDTVDTMIRADRLKFSWQPPAAVDNAVLVEQAFCAVSQYLAIRARPALDQITNDAHATRVPA